MHSGLLWFDNNKKKSTQQKILDGMKRYKEKYGVDPDTCFVNPYDFKDIQINGVSVKTKATIMKNHVWLGIAK